MPPHGRCLLNVVLVFALTSCADRSLPTSQHVQPQAQKLQTPRAGTPHPFFERGVQQPFSAATGIYYHGGPILPTTRVVAVYWSGTALYRGAPAPGTTGAGNQDTSLIGFFLSHLGGSPYFNINTTYADSIYGGHTVQNSVGYTAFWADNQNVPLSNGTFVPDSIIWNELSRGFNSGSITYDSQTVYLVLAGGTTDFDSIIENHVCAYHNWFTYNGAIVVYAAVPTVYRRYNCWSDSLAANGDTAADAEVSPLAHEIEESTTDPHYDGWYTGPGAAVGENADHCQYAWGTSYRNGVGVANMNLGGKDFLVQQNWINTGSGGCVQNLGHNGFYVPTLNGVTSPIYDPGTYALTPSLSLPPSGPATYAWVVTYSNNILPRDSTAYRSGSYSLQVPSGRYSITVKVTPRDVLGPGFQTQFTYQVCAVALLPC